MYNNAIEFFQKLCKSFFIKNKERSFEKRIFHLVSLLAGTISILFVLQNLIWPGNCNHILPASTAVAGILFFSLTYMSGKKTTLTSLVWIYTSLVVFMLGITWYCNGGLTNTTRFLYFITYFAIAILLKRGHRLLLLSLLTIFIVVLFILQIQPSHSLSVFNQKKTLVFFDQLITTLIVIPCFVYLSVIGIRGAYQERKNIERFNRTLTRQKAELKNLVAIRNKLFSVIAHDLRNPIGASNEVLQQLINNTEYDSNERERNCCLQIISKSMANVSQLLENLLHWSNSQLQSFSYNPTPFDITKITQKSISLFTPMAEMKSISLKTEGLEKNTVFADPDSVEIILRNLLSNAIKFTHPSGNVTLTMEQQATSIILCVIDSGIGMDEYTIQTILSETVNLPSTPGTNKEKGYGLGLAICKEYIALNKGKMSIESTPGKGSRFCFTLPLHNPVKA